MPEGQNHLILPLAKPPKGRPCATRRRFSGCSLDGFDVLDLSGSLAENQEHPTDEAYEQEVQEVDE
jgi:hypothetical protein